MKVITLKQPWATLVAEGLKKYEFRSWKLNYRGPLLIHAGAGIDKDATKRFAHLNLDYPQKKIIAKVIIKDCLPLNNEINKKIWQENPLVYENKNRIGFAWQLSSVEKLNIEKNIPGKQGIWHYDFDV